MRKKFLILGLAAASFFACGVACTTPQTSNSSGGSSDVPPQEVEITLNGFEFLESVNCYYGSCIDVYLPLVTDNIGNAVDINYTVKDSENQEVKVESGKFFTMDENGYTIEYSATAIDGTVFTKRQNVRVIKSYISAEATLIDVKGEISYDVLDAIPESYHAGIETLRKEDSTIVEFIPQKGNAESEILSSTEKEVSALNGVYKLVIKAPMGLENTEEEVYSVCVDFYNSDDGMQWLDNTNLNLDFLHTKAEGMTKQIASIDLPSGAVTSQYFYVTDDNGGETGKFIFAVGGLHSAEYYEMWKAKGLKALLVDFYWTSSNCEWKYSGVYSHGSSISNYNLGEWVTLEIPIDVLISQAINITDVSNQTGVANMIKAYYDRFDFQMYIGNFRGKIEVQDLSESKDAQEDFFG